MALKPVLTLVEVKKDASSITIKDSTGSYHVTTNPGGYGTPNQALSTRIGLTWRYWPDTVATAIISTTISFQSNYEITPLTFGKSGKFLDGVHHFKYYNLYAFTGTTFSLTKGSTLVTRALGTTDLTLQFDPLLFTVVEIGGTIYNVDFTKPFTASTFYIQEAFLGTTGVSYSAYRGAEADLKVFVDKAAINLYSSFVVELTGYECNGLLLDTTTKILMYLQAAGYQMLCKNYTKAHNMVVFIGTNYKLKNIQS